MSAETSQHNNGSIDVLFDSFFLSQIAYELDKIRFCTQQHLRHLNLRNDGAVLRLSIGSDDLNAIGERRPHIYVLGHESNQYVADLEIPLKRLRLVRTAQPDLRIIAAVSPYNPEPFLREGANHVIDYYQLMYGQTAQFAEAISQIMYPAQASQ